MPLRSNFQNWALLSFYSFIRILFALSGRALICDQLFKGAQWAEGDQKYCLNMVKKDQLCAIALMKRRHGSKWLLWEPATPFWDCNLKHWYHWRQQFLLFDKTRFDFQTSTSCKFLFLFVHWAKVLTVNSCFQCFLEALSGNNLLLQQTQWTNFLVLRDRC